MYATSFSRYSQQIGFLIEISDVSNNLSCFQIDYFSNKFSLVLNIVLTIISLKERNSILFVRDWIF